MDTIIFDDVVVDVSNSNTNKFCLDASLASDDVQLIELSDEETSEVNFATLSQLQCFINDYSIVEQFSKYEINPWFYYKFSFYFELRALNYKLAKIRKAVGDGFCTIYSSNHALIEALKEHKQVECKKVVKTKSQNKFPTKYFLLAGTRLIISFFQVVFALRKREGYVLDILQNHQLVLGTDQKLSEGNIINQYLIQKLSNHTVLNDLIPPAKGSDLKLRKTYLQFNQRTLFTEYLYLKGFLLNSKKIKSLKAAFENVIKSLPNSVQPEIIFLLLKENSKMTLPLIKYFGIKSFVKNRGQSFIGYSEYSSQQRAIFDAFINNSLSASAIQHGSIHELHPGYVFTKKELIHNKFPSIFFAWGDYWFDLLNQFNYKTSTIKVVGQVRTDIVPKIKAITKKENFIVFASQPQRDEVLRKRVLLDVIDCCKALENNFLVIRPHPREVDDDYFISAGKEVGVDVVIDRTTDLYVLLAKSAAVMTCFSTVGLEACYFSKDLIVIDYLKQDLQGYVASEVAVGVENKKMLSAVLKKLDCGNQLVSDSVRDKYVKNLCFALDGGVCDRIFDNISR